MNRYYLLLKIFGISACFIVDTVAREAIINGDTASSNEFPYQVAISVNGHSPNCGGGIIGDRFILTAASCVVGKDNDLIGRPLSVLAETVNLINPGIIVEVEKVIVLKAYQPVHFSIAKDIAVLKLKKSLGLEKNRNLMILSLPRNYRLSYANKTAVIAGFGWDWIHVKDHEKIGGSSGTHLRFTKVDVLEEKQCDQEHPRLSITKKDLCAKAIHHDISKPRDVCDGDGGGPLVYRGKTVIGVLSAVKAPCSNGTSSAVYARVSQFVNFINNAMHNIESKYMRTLIV